VTPSGPARPDVTVPRWLAHLGAWGWRLVAGAAALYVVLYVLRELRIIVLPFVFGAIVATLLEPVARWLRNHRLPRPLAAVISVVLGLGVITGLVALFVVGIVGELPELGRAMQSGYRDMVQLLLHSPIDVTPGDVERWIDEQMDNLQEQAGSMAQQLMTSVVAVGQVLAMFVITIVFALFFAWDGDRQFERCVRILPERHQHHAREMGRRVWGTVAGYIRGMFVIAAFDAVFFGIALWIIGVPLVLPIMLLTFVGAFVPFVGAIAATAVAALVGLADDGLATAGFVILAGTIVQQVESNLLHPLVMGRTVRLHPAVILFVITAGAILAGIPGVFLAIPVAGALGKVFGYLREQDAL
jgi:putative heme transporter